MDFNCLDFFIPILIMIIICGCLGFLISLFSKLFYINENEKVEEIYKMLPGYNCGACGKSGCKGLAIAILADKDNVDLCKPCKEITKNEIKNFLKSINKN